MGQVHSERLHSGTCLLRSPGRHKSQVYPVVSNGRFWIFCQIWIFRTNDYFSFLKKSDIMYQQRSRIDNFTQNQAGPNVELSVQVPPARAGAAAGEQRRRRDWGRQVLWDWKSCSGHFYTSLGGKYIFGENSARLKNCPWIRLILDANFQVHEKSRNVMYFAWRNLLTLQLVSVLLNNLCSIKAVFGHSNFAPNHPSIIKVWGTWDQYTYKIKCKAHGKICEI